MKASLASFAALLTFILPVQAFAMTAPIIAAITKVPSSAGERWFGFEIDGATTAAASAITINEPSPINGTVSGEQVTVTVAPGVGTSWKFALYQNGADTALTCTIADTATACSDATTTISIAPSDVLSWHVTPVGVPAVGTFALSAILNGTTEGETAIWGATRTNVSATNYFSLYGGSEKTVEASSSSIAPSDFTIDHLYYTVSATIGTGNSIATVFVNGVSSGIVATVPSGSAASFVGSDLTHSVSVHAGDTVSVEISLTGTPSTRAGHWGMRITPAINGEYPLMATFTGAVSATQHFEEMHGNLQNNATVALAQAIVPTAFTLKKGTWFISPAPGAGKTWTITSQNNGVNGTLTGSWSGATATSTSDNTHSDSYALGNLFNWTSIASGGTPNTGQLTKFSAVAYIPPSGASTAHAYLMSLGRLFLNGYTALY